MKKLAIIIALVTALLIMVTTSAMADTISSGDYVKLIAYNPSDNAGIMTYAVSHNQGATIAFTYETFCIQDNVYVWANTWYPVADVSSKVGFFAPSAPPAGAGDLNLAVDYLFYRYKSGTGAYDMSTLANQTDFQDLLWNLQGSGGPFTTDTTAAWYSDLTTWKGDSHLQHTWGTQVINIVSGYSNGEFTGSDIQNQLYNADPVPEPTTMLLLGLGLVGLVGVKRMM